MLSSLLTSSKPGLKMRGGAATSFARAYLTTKAASSSLSSSWSASGALRKPMVLGIRREDKNRWERRVALTPAHVKKLIKETGARILVQPSNTRIFNNASFEKAGATIEEDLAKADAILGIKEVPIAKLIPEKTYVIFSHTHKGQSYNMPSLRAFLDNKIRLIDYELMLDPRTDKRLVLFGRYAGYAGMIDGLHGLGQRLLALGYNSPFIHMGQAHVYPNLECVNTKLRHVGNIIADQGLPEAFAPMIFTFTGSGNVAQGARAIFDKLPHENITVDDLPLIFKDRYNERYKNRLLALQVNAEDYLERIGGGKYSREEYRQHPERYRSVFAQKIAPYTTMLVNGIYWESKYPRLMSTADLAAIQGQRELKNRMLAIADISCDIGGSLEFMSHASTIDSPFFYVDARDGLVEHKDVEKPGVQINSIDNLPTELPFEASQHFGDSLYPFAKALATGELDHPVLSRAIICQDGSLTKQHEHLKKSLTNSQGIRVVDNRRKSVLLAGSGMVSQPLVDYLASTKDTDITIASNDLDEARRLAHQFPNTQAARLDVMDAVSLDKLIKESDVVVSLVPAHLHPQIASAAIRRQKHMVTASYLSPEMQRLDASAKDASVTIINEIGLDPGIDHCSAMKIIDEEHARGGKIKSFISWCGGLTAPENSDNQLGYKFSWSPRGVLTAGLNSAKYKINGQLRQIPAGKLFAHKFGNVPLYPGFAFEGLANRDSLQYADIYGLDLNNMDTMFRGTLRYSGYSDILDCLLRLGFLSLEPGTAVDAASAATFLQQILGVRSGASAETVAQRLSERLGVQPSSPLIGRLMLAFEEFGMLSFTSTATSASRLIAPTVLDAMAKVLQNSLKFRANERDLVCMSHEFGVESADGKSYDVRCSSLTVYGDAKTGETAMARTVGIPAAIATRLLLKGAVKSRGVIRPTIPEVYEPLIEELELRGVVFNESSKSGVHNSLQRRMSWA
ncbi:mitochondrial alpha-aminoadipic semialdehyde synthase [Kickxella alabastrina]|uniref:mitochondrial alpha-aminoadipic semialdehyde synthase n=1 Tax=Kickxella alabastrina TaxID=61397 RepID=UPI00221E4701|nr:mitochondrial alpha-aminoadipic semialdehyde synthase [Kickxella alabastrina]KAI7832971.1 mitochondrial alpha-aminoadipic semialdehyde synthase [Kickxella alabastrina]